MLFKQRELLKALIDERRQYHRELKNQNRNERQFQIGDMVLIRKEVQSNRVHGPGKMQISARGPYRILEEIKPGTYQVQRLPAQEGQGRPGKPYLESAARMEKLPNAIYIHQQTAGTDHDIAKSAYTQVTNPLEGILGVGRYWFLRANFTSSEFFLFHREKIYPHKFIQVRLRWME